MSVTHHRPPSSQLPPPENPNHYPSHSKYSYSQPSPSSCENSTADSTPPATNCHYQRYFKKLSSSTRKWKTPLAGLEPATTGLKGPRSTDWAREAADNNSAKILEMASRKDGWNAYKNEQETSCGGERDAEDDRGRPLERVTSPGHHHPLCCNHLGGLDLRNLLDLNRSGVFAQNFITGKPLRFALRPTRKLLDWAALYLTNISRQTRGMMILGICRLTLSPEFNSWYYVTDWFVQNYCFDLKRAQSNKQQQKLAL